MTSSHAGPRYRRLDRDERQKQILSVARRMFTEKPYAEVSTTEIAEAAGVRRGLIHYYFGAKRDLFLTVVRDVVARIAYDAPAIDPDLPPEEMLDLGVKMYLDASEANGSVWFAAIDAEGFGQDPEVLQILAQARDLTVEKVLAALRIPAPSETMRALLRSYAGLAEAATREWLQRGTLSREQAHVLLAGSLRALLNDIAPEVERA